MSTANQLSINEGAGKDPVRDSAKVAKVSRIPLGGAQSKLLGGVDIQPIPGYYMRWINDDAGRLESAKAAGYEMVAPTEIGLNADEGSTIRRYAGTKDSGEPFYCYLMKCPDEFYQDDLARLQAPLDVIERQIKGNKAPGAPQTAALEGFTLSGQQPKA